MRIPLVVFCAFAAAAVADDALVVASALQPLAEERSGWVLYISTDFNSIMDGQTKQLKSRYGGGHGGYGGGGKGTGTACVVKGSYCNCHYCKVITHLCLPQQTLTIQSNLSLLCLLS